MSRIRTGPLLSTLTLAATVLAAAVPGLWSPATSLPLHRDAAQGAAGRAAAAAAGRAVTGAAPPALSPEVGDSDLASAPTLALATTGLLYRSATVGAGSALAYTYLSRGGSASAPIARWNPCTSIGYRVNTSGGGSGALADVKQAVALASAATGLTFTYRGTTTLVPTTRGTYPAGTQLVLAWVKPGQSPMLPTAPKGRTAAAGQGGASWTLAKDAKGETWGQIVKGYVVLNSTMPLAHGFGAGPTTGWQGTRGQLVMHELGHALGMGHTPVTRPDKAQIMYPALTRKAAVWGAGDRVALKVLGRTSGCLTPR
jgi:hypothetical protein